MPAVASRGRLPQNPAPDIKSSALGSWRLPSQWFVRGISGITQQKSQELGSVIVKGAAGASSEQSFLVTESLEPTKAALLKIQTGSFLVTGQSAIQ